MFKKLFAPTDMTKGSVWKGIVMFTVPMLLGNIAQQLYSTVDTVVVGRYAQNGDNAIAAIGSVFPVINLLLVLFTGISAGTGVMISQYFGAKKRDDLSRTVGNCITCTAIACVALIAVMVPLVEPLLRLLNTPDAIFKDCASYLTISLIGIAGVAYYNVLSGVIRGLGDSASALLYLLVATALNIVLDVYFVAVLHWDVMGVALATVISQLVSSLLCLWKLSRMREYFDFGWRYLRPHWHHIKTLIRLGLPTGATQAIFSSTMILVQSLTNCFGEQFIAAYAVLLRVDGFAMMPNFSFGAAMTTFAGQNVGAGRYDRVKKGALQGTLIAVGCSVVMVTAIVVFGRQLMGIFTETTELINISYHLLLLTSVGYITVALNQSLSGIMRGAGDTMTPMWISLVSAVLIRLPLAYGISFLTRTPELPYGRYECIPLSLLLSWGIGALLTWICYRFGNWKNKSVV